MKRIFFLIVTVLLPMCFKAQTITEAADADTSVMKSVEVPPEYPGGINAMYGDLVEGGMNYPDIAKAKGAEGMVMVKFVVEKDGSISNVEIIKDEVGYGAADEVVRVVKNLKRFEPGKQGGKTVRTEYILPVRFQLNDNNPPKKAKKRRRNK